ncbi:Myb-like, SWIRM and MPN domains 1 [Halocaridina rubra]|uniref:Myb-like, SWIRM and MPN domain-containing protein 1 n=1 Tax=Halocaridina rubra TaxID=373956 RepID=A0AAN9A9L7_HALRR
MASSDELGGTLDVDVVGLVDLDFKNESDFFDFDSGGEFGLFGEAGVALHTTASTTHTSQSSVITSQNSLSAHLNTVTTGSLSGRVSHCGSGPSSCKKSASSRKTKTHWNEIEKELFIRGLELFGANWGRISNFIASKTPGQVRSFHKKWAETANVIQEPQPLDDAHVFMPSDTVCITTDLEDPLGLIETATTTVTTTPFSPKKERSSDIDVSDVYYKDYNSSGELCVPSIGEEWVVETEGFIVEKVSCRAKCIKDSKEKKKENRKKVKKKKNHTSNSHPFKLKSSSKTSKKKKKHRVSDNNKSPVKENKNLQKKVVIQRENSRETLQTFAPPPPPPPPPPPALEGQVVHLIKDEQDDSDVDIDVSDEEQLMIVDKVPSENASFAMSEGNSDEGFETKDHVNNSIRAKNLSHECRKQLTFTFPPPTTERELDLETVTEEERKVHFEYFDGKGVKTPERYIRIRNYFLSSWKQTKPKYLRKTNARAGLKHCGDVNSVGKIFDYLEKIGAINFGCSESNYTAPLVVGVKHKEKVSLTCKPVVKVDRSDMTRQKQKKKWEFPLSEGGGLTISHDESGAVIDACHIPEAPRNRGGPGGRGGSKLEQFKLVRCLEHDPDTPAPFSVIMHAHALITLDLHSHTSLAEVMGLLGGYYDPATSVLYITVAVPTKAVSSGVECDMCPLSQSAACTAIHGGGVQVVGWYHSHPTFPPNPSIQDIDSQSQMQQWFARQESPFLGVIVSPFCPTNLNEASQIRCIVLDAAPHGDATEDTKSCRTPYKLHWSVSEEIPGGWEEVCEGVRSVVGSAREDPMAVEWRGEWRGQVTNWEKAIASLSHHLPSQLHSPLQTVRTKFLAAVREYMES